MQRRKGVSYERQIAARMRDVFPGARRGLSQPRSGAEVPDVEGVPFWLEAKHRKRVNVRQALEEAEAEATRAGKRAELPPLVVARDNGKPDVVCMLLDDFLRLVEAMNEHSPPATVRRSDGRWNALDH